MARSKTFAQRFPARDSQMIGVLGRNVRRLRKARGWTQESLAAEARIEQTAVSLIENGRANPTLLAVEDLAAALGVGFLDLFRPDSLPRSSSKPRNR